MGMLEALTALAALAGNTVVAAATTDAWEACRRGFVRLLGRGDAKKAELTEQRLAETYKQLTTAAGADLERARAVQEAQWTTRLTDLLEEDLGVEADLQSLVEEIRAQLPAGVVSAADHSVAAGGDVNISASEGGVATGVIHGDVAPPGPTPPGPAGSWPGPGPSGFLAQDRWPPPWAGWRPSGLAGSIFTSPRPRCRGNRCGWRCARHR